MDDGIQRTAWPHSPRRLTDNLPVEQAAKCVGSTSAI
jgi:hypothetical protein